MEELICRERKGTGCAKWDNLSRNGFTRDDLCGLWVADMDFACPLSVRKAIADFADFGVFGYDSVPDGYYESFIRWQKERHGADIKKEWIRYSPGVVAAFNYLVQIFTEEGDAVIIQTPVYYPFMKAVTENGRKLVTNELVRRDGAYGIDLEDFEEKIRENGVKAFILCSPHNPVGRVWTREELEGMLSVCARYDVFVIADEIHQDFELTKKRQIPVLTLGDTLCRVAVLTAPSKTFNMAGLKNSIVQIPDETIRKRWDEYTGRLHVAQGNSIGYRAAAAAYTGGGQWLDQVLEVVRGNYELLKKILRENAPEAQLYPLEGTYLAWLDLGAYVREEELAPFLEDTCGLAFDYGKWFGGDSEGFVRINLATEREKIEAAANALAAGIRAGSRA